MKSLRKRKIKKWEMKDDFYENWKEECRSLGANIYKDEKGKYKAHIKID